MRALVWIVDDSWASAVAAAAEFLPSDAEITLLHVRAGDAESVARGALRGLLGRPHPRQDGSMKAISEQSANEILSEARTLLGREANIDARAGRAEREVVAAAEQVDLLVLVRDTDRTRRGPHSLGPTTRYVVEHAPCAVLLVWPSGEATAARVTV
jgi:nucleotide-binding universal stress UspA family protein